MRSRRGRFRRHGDRCDLRRAEVVFVRVVVRSHGVVPDPRNLDGKVDAASAQVVDMVVAMTFRWHPSKAKCRALKWTNAQSLPGCHEARTPAMPLVERAPLERYACRTIRCGRPYA